MSEYIDAFSEFEGVFFTFLCLLTVSFLWYRHQKKCFRKWQFMTVGINSRQRYEALKSSKSLLTSRSK